MNHKLRIAFSLCVFLAFFIENSVASNGTNCVTPNGETATCILLTSCPVLVEALQTRTEKGRNYTLQSHCGFEGKIPLVCCGTLSIDGKDPLDQIIDDFYRSSTSSPNNEGLDDIINDFYKATSLTDQTIKNTNKDDDKSAEIISHNFDANSNLPDKSVCGLEVHESWQEDEQTDLHESPWMAVLEYVDETASRNMGIRCTGILINKRYVLTAAQCILDRTHILARVRLGDWDVTSDPDCFDMTDYSVCGDSVVTVNILQTITHPFYNRKLGSNNVGLIKLEKDVTYTDFIRPICLPPQDFSEPKEETPLTVTGWGRTEDNLSSKVKLKGSVTFHPLEECEKSTEEKSNKLFSNLQLEVLRACGKKSQKPSCQESLGGPVMRRYTHPIKKQSQWYLEGIVSAECNPNEDHIVYIRISRYIDWIIKTIGSD